MFSTRGAMKLINHNQVQRDKKKDNNENDYSTNMISSNKRTSSQGIGAPQLNDFCRGISIKLNESPNLRSRKYST